MYVLCKILQRKFNQGIFCLVGFIGVTAFAAKIRYCDLGESTNKR